MTKSIFGGLDFYTESRGVIFSDFSLFLPMKSSILTLKPPKLSQRSIDRMTKIILMKFFENLCQNWENFDKNYHSLQKYDLF